jgi:hypothetical protein
MPRVNDILQFHFSKTEIQKSAKFIIPNTIVLLIENQISKLQEISERIGPNPFPNPPTNLIPQVFRKFKQDYKNKKLNYDRKELRTLTYSLSYSENNLSSIFSNDEELDYVIQMLSSQWKESFIFGLIDCLLKNWETSFDSSLSKLTGFIVVKLKLYEGNRNSIIGLKNNLKYFEQKNGDLILGKELGIKNVSILKVTNFLSVPDTWITYPYFSRVIVSFYEQRKNNFKDLLDDFEQILIGHRNNKTNKRLLSKLIIQADKSEFAHFQDKVKKMAFDLIGDPENRIQWLDFDGATEKEKQDLDKARSILNEWITRQFINVFFNVCINDVRRKNFWLKHVSNISSFKVYGPLRTYLDLKRDERISQYLDLEKEHSRFIKVNSNKNVSAFIIYMKNYMLIEFSEDGYAFYGYKVDGNKKPNISAKLNSVDDLRNGYERMAIERKYSNIIAHHAEGRLFHKDGNFQDGSTLKWEDVFNRWLEIYNIV